MKDINNMTRKEFEALPFIDEFDVEEIEVDRIVLLPTRIHHDSGYNVYYVIACNNRKAIGKCSGYDTFSIFMSGDYNRVGIDCLRGSGLMSIFLPANEYKIISLFHEIRRKETLDKKLLETIKVVEEINGQDLKPMWDNWKQYLGYKEIMEDKDGKKN